MQDFFCPRCGRRMPDGHCSYCESRQRRKVNRSSIDGPDADSGVKSVPAEEKIISFDSIKDSAERKNARPRMAGGGKQDIVLNFIDLDADEINDNKKKTGPAVNRAKNRSGNKNRNEGFTLKKLGSVISHWFSERISAVKRFADELINPEEE